MSQISKKPLTQSVEERVLNVFAEFLVSIKSAEEARKIMDDFLAPTEKLMLAKRLGIYILFVKGAHREVIQEKLHVGNNPIFAVKQKVVSFGAPSFIKFIHSVINRQFPDSYYDPAPFRGKRLYRKKSEGLKYPYKNLPY